MTRPRTQGAAAATVGIWSMDLLALDGASLGQVGRDLESWGYEELWLPGVHNVTDIAGAILATTTQLRVRTGVINVWAHPARCAAAAFSTLEQLWPCRFDLGIGVGHRKIVERSKPGAYARPLEAMSSYFDELDMAGVPRDRRLVGAMGSRMTRLAGERSSGVLLYHATTEQTARSRDLLGAEPRLAVEQAVVIEENPVAARAVARSFLRPYLKLENYVQSWLRAGFGEDDVADGGSDRLVDALVAWGSADAVGSRISQQAHAGADHVAIQVLSADGLGGVSRTWRALAPSLAGCAQPSSRK